MLGIEIFFTSCHDEYKVRLLPAATVSPGYKEINRAVWVVVLGWSEQDAMRSSCHYHHLRNPIIKWKKDLSLLDSTSDKHLNVQLTPPPFELSDTPTTSPRMVSNGITSRNQTQIWLTVPAVLFNYIDPYHPPMKGLRAYKTPYSDICFMHENVSMTQVLMEWVWRLCQIWLVYKEDFAIHDS